MTQRMLTIGVALAVTFTCAAGQQHHGGNASGIGPGGECATVLPVAPDDIVTLQGAVVSFNSEPGTNTPPLLISVGAPEGEEQYSISTGPFYLFDESGIEVTEGSAIEVVGFACADGGPTVVAIRITIDPEGDAPQVLELRTEEGYPLWGQNGPADGGHIGLRDLVTYDGVLAATDLTPESGCATFSLEDGTQFVIPRHVLLALDVTLEMGDLVTVTAFVSQRQEDHIVAVELVVNGGEPLVLIDPDDRPPRPQFIRGDANGSGNVDIGDAIEILRGLFGQGPRQACQDASDANDDGTVDISDAVCALRHMFGGGGPLPAPFPGRGMDATRDRLLCEQ